MTGIPKSLFTVFIRHVVFCTAVVFKTVMPGCWSCAAAWRSLL